MRPGSRPMVRWCAQAGQAGSYYQYHHVGRVGKVPWTRAVFSCAFLCKDLAKQPYVISCALWAVDLGQLSTFSPTLVPARGTRALQLIAGIKKPSH